MNETELRDQLKDAMRARDTIRTRVLRSVLAALKNATIDKRGAELADADILAILKREAKQTREQLEFAEKAGREEAITEHRAELAVVEGLLPGQLDADALRAAIEAIVADTGASAIGPVMKELGARHPGAYDGKTASALVREILG